MRSIAWKWGTFGGVIAFLVGSLLWFYPETENSIDRTSPASLDDTASADRRPATTEDQSSRLSGPPGTTPSRATTPDAFLVYGVSFDTLDPVSEYLTLESESLHKSGAAMEAFGILDACRQIPGSQSVTAEIENTLALSEARQTCKEITAAASLARHELIEQAASLGDPEAILLLPSFPPPFSNHRPEEVSERFLSWQQQTVARLESLADQGSVDAQLRLARLYAGEFPAFEDLSLAYLYLDELLRSGNLSPVQQTAAASLRARLPKPDGL